MNVIHTDNDTLGFIKGRQVILNSNAITAKTTKRSIGANSFSSFLEGVK